MLIREEDIRNKAVLAAAEEVMLAIRTAPKTRGQDKLVLLLADGGEKEMLANKMTEISENAQGTRPSFARDAVNVQAAQAVLLIGVQNTPFGLNCNFCGFPTCGEKPPAVPCAFVSMDLGIGTGVAASLLGQKHIDNRIMFSVGYAALELDWFQPEVTLALGIPLSVSGKSIFFDRK